MRNKAIDYRNQIETNSQEAEVLEVQQLAEVFPIERARAKRAERRVHAERDKRRRNGFDSE